MNKIKCLIVDDEPLAQDVLKKYIGQLDSLCLEGTCNNAIEALTVLQQQKIDLLFLDIQMPKLSGIDFLKTLSQCPKVILTTAYRDYAPEAFELSVMDYLLKPIPFERFLTSINKYHALHKRSEALPAFVLPLLPATTDPFIYLKADKKMVKVLLKDIIYIESLKDYVRVKTPEKEVITYQKISYLEEKLPDESFIRIHRSFIISIDKIKSFNSTSIEVAGKELPIGRLYKDQVMKTLGLHP
ncbi:MAG: LytTR family DNA-binding domain-containing protein [Candidatus Pedobacter colombiensis]|uniref:LytTR family DNA-binding domain-containing protein n=1 Tax=Candidatus Pedobacter colombiensis TaxID=3121371 RepID=A0AAJ5WA87_9SPHI|nr:LytTR family DNA-binding domain-containing protein [Pedobacter sp.]WEK20886.1 MAG: LytTR family DNA-binding domain-containing protein [Pedobacter sp.]